MVAEESVSVRAAARACAPGWLIRVAVTTALAGAAVPAATAQEAQGAAGGESQLEEITVTGSRIARAEYDADTPVVSVSSQALQNTAEVGIDQALAKLPQFVPGTNQFTSSGDVQATPTNSPGIATANLRGLGSNRTLVLLDGRRTQPANASLAVDLNTIPATAVDSVEIITGGAGSTYGADAVAGVVNFKLKRNYQGVTVDLQSGQTTAGDGAQTQLSALLGSNFADNRGNAMIGLTYSKREPIYRADRDFFARAFTDPGTPGVSSFPNFGGYVGGGTQAAVDSVFASKGVAAGGVATSNIFYFNPGATTADSTLFVVSRKTGQPQAGYTGSLFPYYKILSDGSVASNTPDGYISLPLTRYSMFAHGHYDVSDHVSFYMQANFDQNETKTLSGGFAPAVNQWSITVPRDAGHPVPTELATLLDSRANPNAAWTLNKSLDYLGTLSLRTTTNTYEILAGVRGDLGFKDWTYDAFASRGDTDQNATYSGFADLAAYQALMNKPNYGANADYNNGRTGLLAHCTSGINPFVTTPVSQDCIDIIAAPLKTSTNLRQNQVELDVQGTLFAMPAGDFKLAVGADYRKNEFEYLPDRAMSTSNITSLAVGIFDTTKTVGEIGVKEGYVEALAPLLKDKPFVKSLNLNLGYRRSDYDTATGGVNTWKATADWDVNEWVRLRGGRQNANRAPNVAELFQPAVFSVVPWPDHDPCSILTRAPYGNVASNPDRAKVQALCSTLAGGFPIDSSYTGNQPVYFPLGRDLTQGNPDVKSEDAKTWTIGTVLRSPFDADILRRLTLTVDYYSVDIEGAIAPASTQTVYQLCLNGLGTNPTYDPNNAYCKLIIRDPNTGFWVATNAQYQNLGAIKTSGIDSQVDWAFNTPFFGGRTGTLSTNINFNYLHKYDVQNFAGGPVLHYADSIGAPQPYGAQFRWKLFTTVGYSVGPASASINWRHLPSVRNFAKVSNPGAGQLDTPSYDLFDLSARYAVGASLDIRAGVDNLFNRQPNTVGILPGTTNAAGVTDVQGSYDVYGRRYFVGAVARF